MIDKKLEEWYKIQIEKTQSVWLLQWFLRRLKKNQNAIVVFPGGTGSGKSLTAIRLGQLLDPDFNASRIVFTVKDFLALVNSNLKSGSVIIFDDAGLGINAREWRSKHAMVFGMLTQGFRYKQIITIITVPSLGFIEKQSRKLVHLIFESSDIQGKPKPKLVSENPFNPDWSLKKYPVIQRGYDGIKIPGVKFKLPDEELVKEYEKSKSQYMDSRFKGFEDQLSGQEDPPEKKEEKETTYLRCEKCGYSWEYTGNRFYANCPSCGHRVEAVKGIDKNCGIEITCTNPKCRYVWNYTGNKKETRCPKCGKHITVNLEEVLDIENRYPVRET